MTDPTGLRRTLGFTDLALITAGTVIGSGIFLTPGIVLQNTGGRTGVALGVWTVSGVLSLLGALTYAELGAMKPHAGGLYVYLRDAFGPLPAFLYGWASFAVISSGSVATLAVAFSGYLGGIVSFGGLPTRVVSVAVIAVAAAINVAGTRRSATVQNWMTGAKVVALLALSATLIARGHPAPAAPGGFPPLPPVSLAAGIGAAMIATLWAYEGWQYVTFSAGEARDPQRTFPRAITVATLGLIAIYLLVNLGYLAALGPDAAARSERIAADAMGTVLGPAAGTLVAVLILVSISSALNGLMLTTPRMYFSMARDGVFFQGLARVHPGFGTPALAIVALAGWSAILAATGTFVQLLTYVVFAGWIFYALGALGIFVYRRREPGAVRPFRTPGYPLTPVLFVAAAALLVLNTIATQPGRAGVGLTLVATGIPAFYAWRITARRRAAITRAGGIQESAPKP
jgi:APA family basic amino acid/polyamine antiporter